MIVSHPARVLFVHVQKTGGSTVQSVLLDRLPGAERLSGLPGAKHAHLRTALERHPELRGYWTFGFVRNPWARLWSWWSMIDRRQVQRDEGHVWATRRIDNNNFWSGVLRDLPDFEAFVLRGPEQFARLRTPQVRYLRAGERRADFVGRTCVIRTGRVTRTFGQAEVRAEDGSSAIVQVRQAGEDDLHAGTVAVLYDFDPEGEFFWVVPTDIAMKGN